MPEDVAHPRPWFKTEIEPPDAEGISMKVALFINTQCPEDADVPAQIQALLEQVRVARDASSSCCGSRITG
jgi:hypothetical protein